MATRLEDLGPKLDALARELEKIAIDIPLVAAKEAEGIIKGRVWGTGGARAADGSTLPQYSDGYKKYGFKSYTKRAGSQKSWNKTTSTWNLDATGDLFNSLKVVTKKGSARLLIVGGPTTGTRINQPTKAEMIEDQAGKVIFELSDQEVEELRKQVLIDFRQAFNAAIKKVF